VTYKQEIKRVTDLSKKYLDRVRPGNKATKKDITVVIEDFIKQDYTRTFHNKLYSDYGPVYASLLEILVQMDSEGEFKNIKGE